MVAITEIENHQEELENLRDELRRIRQFLDEEYEIEIKPFELSTKIKKKYLVSSLEESISETEKWFEDHDIQF